MDEITEYAGFDNLSCVACFKKHKHKISKQAEDLASLMTDELKHTKHKWPDKLINLMIEKLS